MTQAPETVDGVVEPIAAPGSEAQPVPKGGQARRPTPAQTRMLVVAVVAVLVGTAAGWMMNGRAADIAALESQAADLEQRLEETEAKLAAADSENRTLAAVNEDLEDEIAGLQAAVPLPDYSGRPATEAEADAKSHGWSVTRAGQPSAKAAGTVLSQEPLAGAQMKLGASVKLVVAEPMPAQWYEVWSQSGSGRVITPVIDLPAVDSGNLRVTYDFKGTGHNALWLCNMVGEKEDLLHNDIGSIKNTSALYLSWEGLVFDIEGSGRWTVKLEAYGVPSQ